MQAKIKVKNGYWTYNGKLLSNCTFPERQVALQFIINSKFSFEVEETMLLKQDDAIATEQKYLTCEFVKL
jgi:hypothetical protein